jgi:hypothetical protein
MKTSAKKHKELRRVRKANNIPVYSATPHKPNKYNADGSLNSDYKRFQDLRNMIKK